jgi:hypothetical protein
MNLQEMVSAVAEDLKHIPDGPDLDIQNELRVLYNSHRRKDLTLDKSRKETITYCMEVIKSSYPGWSPNVDTSFFGLK